MEQFSFFTNSLVDWKKFSSAEVAKQKSDFWNSLVEIKGRYLNWMHKLIKYSSGALSFVIRLWYSYL